MPYKTFSLIATSRYWMRANPSLKLTRYGRHCKPGLRYSYIVSVRAYSTCLRGQLSSNYKGFPTYRKRFASVFSLQSIRHRRHPAVALWPGQGQAASLAAWRSAPLTRSERRYAHARLDATVLRIQACRSSGEAYSYSGFIASTLFVTCSALLVHA